MEVARCVCPGVKGSKKNGLHCPTNAAEMYYELSFFWVDFRVFVCFFGTFSMISKKLNVYKTLNSTFFLLFEGKREI